MCSARFFERKVIEILLKLMAWKHCFYRTLNSGFPDGEFPLSFYVFYIVTEHKDLLKIKTAHIGSTSVSFIYCQSAVFMYDSSFSSSPSGKAGKKLICVNFSTESMVTAYSKTE